MILDPTFLIDIRHGDPDALRCASTLEGSPHQLRVSAITMAELQTGVTRATESVDEFTEMMEVTATKDIVPVTRAIAHRGGRLHGELKDRGASVELDDCLIAPTALDYEESVVTPNVSHFERFDGVLIQEY